MTIFISKNVVIGQYSFHFDSADLRRQFHQKNPKRLSSKNERKWLLKIQEAYLTYRKFVENRVKMNGY